MKMMIASDIHGSLYWCKKLLERMEAEQAQRLILLGDLLYHGPRNPLPQEYDPQGVAELLNGVRDRLFCVCGNCDAQVDQLVLEFPLGAEYMLLPQERRMIFVTHGHVFHEGSLPPFQKGDVLLHGHTHVPSLKNAGDYYYINPGSVSLPKENSQNSYMTLENGVFTLKNLSGEVLDTLSLKE